MITVRKAYQLILDCIYIATPRLISTSNSVGQILRQDIIAEREHPPFHRVAMDGIALHLESHNLENLKKKQLKIEGVQRAGQAAPTLKDQMAVFEVMTGASLPIGCNCVVRYEEIEVGDGVINFLPNATFKDMQNIHIKGSDFSKDSILLKEGKKILSVDIGVIVSQGIGKVLVGAEPKIAVISTGDELVDIEEPMEDYQIRRSNSYAIEAELKEHQFRDIDLFHLADDRDEIEKGLRKIINDFDFVILSGGISKGKFDFIPDVLETLGVEKKFHKVKQRPGKPLFFGVHDEMEGVFALPGNPVSSIICLRRYVIPALLKYKGLDVEKILPQKAILNEDIIFKKDLTFFKPIQRISESQHQILVVPVSGNGSGDYQKLSLSDGFIELPEGVDLYKKGDAFDLFLWGER